MTVGARRILRIDFADLAAIAEKTNARCGHHIHLQAKSQGSAQHSQTVQDAVFGCKEGEVEKLWQELFTNPSEWLDHRLDKVNPRFPDFKHKNAQKSLWLNSKWIPPWVKSELALLRPGTIESSNFSWNQRLARCAQAGQHEETIKLFQQMQRNGISLDRFTFFPVLTGCASLGLLEDGRRVHTQIIQGGFETDLFIGSSLVDMYVKCGTIEDAWKVFNKMAKRDVVAWNTMILGLVKSGEGQQALELFRQMQQEGVNPDPISFVAVLNVCASKTALEEGRCAHKEIIRRGYECHSLVGNSIIDMYVKCGSIEEAQCVFNRIPKRDAVSWTAIILGYVKCGKGQQALDVFGQMKQAGVKADSVTFLGVLNACASLAALEEGRHVHKDIVWRGYKCDGFLGSSLIDMYAKCGSIEEARSVFNKMWKRDVVAWTAMIVGCVKCGEGHQALELFAQMQSEKVEPDPVTFVAVMNACASVAALEEGRHVHKEIVQRGLQSHILIGNSIVDMYAKCGSIEEAENVFNQMPTRDMTGWTTLLTGYSMHGFAREALEHFKKMCNVVEVDGVSFTALLSACSHGGLVDEALEYFRSISEVYNIFPTLEHYACVVDLLGRAGRLGEAEDLLTSMIVEPNAAVWMSLLGACKIHGNVEMAEHCANRISDLDPGNGAMFTLLSNVYAVTGKYDGSTKEMERRCTESI